jgi:tetratricopeptide (TPR) repeat protein
LLTAPQQALVKEVYSAISQQPQDINMMQLTSSVNALQTYIASTAPAAIPSLLFLALGDGFVQLQQTNNAVSAWQQSVSANQYNYFAHDRLAQAHRQWGEFVVAEQHYNEAINAWPDFSSGYRNRGILYDLYLGDKARALDDYRQYKQLLTLAGQQTREVDRWIKEMQGAVNMSSR